MIETYRDLREAFRRTGRHKDSEISIMTKYGYVRIEKLTVTNDGHVLIVPAVPIEVTESSI